MTILGIDPGTTRIGYGVIENHASRLVCKTYGVIENVGREAAHDFLATEHALEKLITTHHPDRVGLERLFFFKNKTTALKVAEMRGVIQLVCARHQVPVFGFTPLQVKQAVSAYGRAGKNQVEHMVKVILGIKESIRPDDAADALAIAICATHTIIPS